MDCQMAIDGPAGSGKSTVARRVSEALHWMHLDSGALYRAVALYMLRRGKNVSDAGSVASALEECLLYLRYIKGEQRVYLDEEDVSGIIRTSEVGTAAAKVASVPQVRERVNELIRSVAASHEIVMDGRDIGTDVLPDAAYKFFLTASLEVRAARRAKELVDRGEEVSIDALIQDLKRRDEQDMNRQFAPLRQAKDALVIDTTHLSIDQVVAKILSVVKAE